MNNDTLRIGKKEFSGSQTHIMGILNVTPDSFSDGGRWLEREEALRHTEQMIRDGAAVIDVGGESTRPGYTAVSEEEETARVVPIIEYIKSEFDICVSVDTYKPSVAEAALRAGADMVNDIWGLRRDPGMAQVIAKFDAACCLMHNAGSTDYGDLLAEIKSGLTESLRIARDAGIREDGIILDPGIGFSKTPEQNLEVIRRLECITELGYPVLLGASRKSVIGLALDLPAREREEGTAVTTVFAVQKGCSFVRVHDVRGNERAIRMTQAILSGRLASIQGNAD